MCCSTAPEKTAHLENCKTIIRNLGQAGIPVMGYNFSIAGVCGRTHRPYARGGAMSVGMEGPLDTPMPNGMAWNMVVDQNAPPGNVPSATPEQLWQRLDDFLGEVMPVAEEAGRETGAASGRSAATVHARPTAAGLSTAALPAGH